VSHNPSPPPPSRSREALRHLETLFRHTYL